MLYFLKQCIKASASSLFSNKIRSFLTMLGIIIGVGAVIIIMSVGAGAQSLILSQLESFGSDLIGILPGKSEKNGPPAAAMGVVITTLTYDDMLAIKDKRNVQNVKEAAAYVNGTGSASYGSNSSDAKITGTTTGYVEIEKVKVGQGRFFTQEEESGVARVAILGTQAAADIFGESNPIGKRFKLKKQSFEVIGILEKKGNVLFQSYDDRVIIPISTAQKLILGINYVNFIRVKADDKANLDRAVLDIQALLRDRHDIADQTGNSDDFSTQTVAEAINTISTITNAIKYFLAAMAALSLVVGGIGIMNIMLIRVAERTREIGLRKSLGASSSNILNQFILESATITLIGGVFGIIFGAVISFLIALIANALGYDWAFSVSLTSIILSVLVSVSVGIIFGAYPAFAASRLSPVEALRYE